VQLPVGPPIPVGTTFIVPLDTAKIIGIVKASSSHERIFCTTLSPPWTQEGWELAGEALWIVDDYALRDGSWPIVSTSADIVREPPPRFATTAKDGSPLFVVFDPVSLTAIEKAPVDGADDQREWSTAPRYIPADVRTFEAALAKTFGLPPPIDPKIDQEETSRRLLGVIRSHVADVTQPRPFDHALLFRDKKRARAALAALEADGLTATLDAPLFRSALLTIVQQSVPSFPAIAPQVARWQAFAREHGGEYDGFGCPTDA